MRRILMSVVGLVGLAVLCLVVVSSIRGCGSTEARKDTKVSPTVTAPTQRTNQSFNLVRRGLNKQAEIAKDGQPTSGRYKAATGAAADQAIEAAETEGNLADQASFEEVQIQKKRREVQALQDEFARALREARELPNKIAYQEGNIRSTEATLSRLQSQLGNPLKSAEQREVRLHTIEVTQARIASMQAELGNLREQLDKTANRVEELRRAISNPVNISRRMSDGKGTVIIEE
jgi:chromosome segregation ATPase